MLTKIERTDIPDHRGNRNSEMHVFARETLEEFVEVSEVGDVMEVTGFPIVCQDETANLNKLMNVFATEYRYLKGYDRIKRFRRKGRVFLEREQPIVPENVRPVRKPNPYPGD